MSTAPATKGRRFPPGTILGSYRLGDVLGEGGMGTVYLATHVRLDRLVAIKMLRSEFTHDAAARRRFFAEARAVNKIAHPNVIEITDFVETAGDDNYYIMELLEGSSLAELVNTAGTLPIERSMAIMTQLADALVAVHSAGVVHRDIKPHNVILIERGGQSDFVKLADFGTAKLGDVGEDTVIAAGHGTIVGTPRYMSPEASRGGPIDHRTDIYSFGVMLYEAVIGRVPFSDANIDTLVTMVRTVAPTPPSHIANLPTNVPVELEALILACLAKDANARPASMEVVARELAAIADKHDWIVYELSVTSAHQAPNASRVSAGHMLPPVIVEVQVPVHVPVHVHVPVLVAAPPVRRRWWIPVATAMAMTVIGVVLLVASGRGGGKQVAPPQPAGPTVAEKVAAEVAIADQRITAGRFVAAGGDDALSHLLAARALAPGDAGVRDRLHAIASQFQALAEQASAAGSLAEADAHLQTVLAAEPDNGSAAARMSEIEDRILKAQRAKPAAPVAPAPAAP